MKKTYSHSNPCRSKHPQEPLPRSVYTVMKKAHNRMSALERRIKVLEAKLAPPEDTIYGIPISDEKALNEFAKENPEIDVHGYVDQLRRQRVFPRQYETTVSAHSLEEAVELAKKDSYLLVVPDWRVVSAETEVMHRSRLHDH